MQVTDKQQLRWKKGVFHKGEVEQYLKQMSHEEAEFLLMRKENLHAPEFIRAIMILNFLAETLRENKKKKVKIKRLAKRYSQDKNIHKKYPMIKKKLDAVSQKNRQQVFKTILSFIIGAYLYYKGVNEIGTK